MLELPHAVGRLLSVDMRLRQCGELDALCVAELRAPASPPPPPRSTFAMGRESPLGHNRVSFPRRIADDPDARSCARARSRRRRPEPPAPTDEAVVPVGS